MDIDTLRIIWFVLIAVLWIGYLVLEGFDFGVGMLLPVLGRNDTERRVMINTIGPVWDGNEVWLLTAGGATFAAFPLWYATLFSAFYLPLLLILVGADPARRRLRVPRQDRRADAGARVGLGDHRRLLLPSLLWGVAFGNLVRGVDVATVRRARSRVLLAALNPYAPARRRRHAPAVPAPRRALPRRSKTTGDLQRARDDARPRRSRCRCSPAVRSPGRSGPSSPTARRWTWVAVASPPSPWSASCWSARAGREGLGFLLTSVVTVVAVVMIFGCLFPNVLPINDAAST